ncbi:MAG: CotH kinase family protein, partial [Deltaproteobacteria bacterium]|nr:CotH kinase family protein [Deltaproteobacteria bacterium]
FCQLPCAADLSCPEGSQCAERVTAEGEVAKVCAPDSGTCACSPAAAKGGWTTPCFVPAIGSSGLVVGKCAGTWTCSAGGCDAPQPATETCNGQDDDCDGATDEAEASGDLCDDGDPCTVGETCAAGTCSPGTDQCSCHSDGDCASGNACQGKWFCDKTTPQWHCATVPASAPDCSGLVTGPCATPGCDPKSGACLGQAKPDGSACDADGNACTVGDSCQGGLCQPGPKLPCDDGNPCTFDSCGAKGCGHQNTAGPCDDGLVCTSGDTCKQGACVGTAKACSDGNPCTIDSCDPSTGECATAPSQGGKCDDGDACTQGEVCAGGQCGGGKAATCSDSNPCTDDSCDPKQGCVHTANSAPCDDGKACSQGDTCAGGTCQPGPSVCDCTSQADCDAKQKADPCLGALICNLAAKEPTCVPKPGAAPLCPAGGPCATATCEKGVCGQKPSADGTACSDGQACTSGDACKGGACQGSAVACDDGNACTVDACALSGGIPTCSHTASAGACSDGNPCSVGDTCTAGKCAPGPQKDCSDGTACTIDTCLPASGACAHDSAPLQGKVCSTGQGACGPATCSGALCLAAAATPCDDGNPCTADSCTPDVGCTFVPNTAPCNDNNPCTIQDACKGGKCAGGKPNPCDDGNACTDDSCAAPAGCQHAANTATCDDGDACSVEDHCKNSACASKPLDCGDGNPCTVSTCSAGLCSPQVAVADGTKCKGKSACVGQATCQAAVCVDAPANCPAKKGQEIVPVAIPSTFAPAQTLFDPYGFHEVKLTVATSDWTKYLELVAKVQQTNTWFQAQATFDGKDYGQVGIRPFGFGSLTVNPQKPNIRVKFDAFVEDQTGPDDVHSLRFKPSGQDRTWLKQILGPVIVQQAGGYGPRFSWVRIWVNGQPYGLYQMIEHVDKHFYKVNFGNNDGNEYQRKKSCMGLNCPGGNCGNLPSYYVGDPGAATELVEAATLAQSEPDASLPAKLAARIDLASLYAEYAWEAISSDFDTLSAAGQNYTIYVNQLTAQMEFIPTGQDLNQGLNGSWYDLWKPWGPPCNWCGARVDAMYSRIASHAVLKPQLVAVMQKIHCGLYAPATFVPIIQAYKKLLWPDLTQDPKGYLTPAQINKAYDDLVAYVQKRSVYLDGIIGVCP